MNPANYKMPTPEAFRGFIEGVQKLQDYLRTNAGEKLADAEEQFNESLTADPNFTPSQYYKAIVLTHARKAKEAIPLLEGLNEKDGPFQAEVLYNLAFAYTKTYEYVNVTRALDLVVEAEASASDQQRPDLELLIKAMAAWVMSVFGGLDLRNKEDFPERQLEYLPRTIALVQSILDDERLESLPLETRNTIEAEANNAAGIAFMYMGQHSVRFAQSTDYYWERADENYRAALNIHSRDVRVLDNVATLNLLKASRATRLDRMDDRIRFSRQAKETTLRALSYNRHDKFRYLNLARACAFLEETEEALVAAGQIRYEPGVVRERDVEQLEKDILARDLDAILSKYPIEEEPPVYIVVIEETFGEEE